MSLSIAKAAHCRRLLKSALERDDLAFASTCELALEGDEDAQDEVEAVIAAASEDEDEMQAEVCETEECA